jgi:hypothetical protein
MTGQHLRDLETSERYATLLAILLEAKATLIDQALDLHDRMIGALFNRGKRRHAEEFQKRVRPCTRKFGSMSASVKLCYKPDEVGSILFPLSEASSHGKRLYKASQRCKGVRKRPTN